MLNVVNAFRNAYIVHSDCNTNNFVFPPSRFQSSLVAFGVDKVDIFQTNDLFEKKDLGAVTNTMFALDRAVCKLRRGLQQ